MQNFPVIDALGAPLLIPRSEIAEHFVTAALMVTPEQMEACSQLQPDHFGSPLYRQIYAVELALYRRRTDINPDTVATLLAKETLDQIGGPEGLREMTWRILTTVGIEHHIQEILRHASLRALERLGQAIVAESYRNGGLPVEQAREVAEMIETYMRALTEVTSAKTGGYALISEIDERDSAAFEAFLDDPRIARGLRCRLDLFDRILGGFRPGELLILAGPPSCGKTALALHIAANVDAPAFFLSLEMMGTELKDRIVYSRARVDRHKGVDREYFLEEEREDLREARRWMVSRPIAIEDSVHDWVSIKAAIRRDVAARDTKLVVVDHIDLISYAARQRDGRYSELSDVTREAKQLATELGISLLLLSQLNRHFGERAEKGRRVEIPELVHLRDSGSKEQDADKVVFIVKADFFDQDLPESDPKRYEANVIVRKNRNGPLGERIVTALWWCGAFFDREQHRTEPR
jgi:replicative DNA helicase